MKKLTRKSLDELAKIYPVLSDQEQRGYVAGLYSGTQPTGSVQPGGSVEMDCVIDCVIDCVRYVYRELYLPTSVTGIATPDFCNDFETQMKYNGCQNGVKTADINTFASTYFTVGRANIDQNAMGLYKDGRVVGIMNLGNGMGHAVIIDSVSSNTVCYRDAQRGFDSSCDINMFTSAYFLKK